QLGGEADLTPAQRILVEEVTKKAAIVDTLGNYILTRVRLVNEPGNAILPLVLQHDHLQMSLTKMLTVVGLQRADKQRDIRAIVAYVNGPGTALPPDLESKPKRGRPPKAQVIEEPVLDDQPSKAVASSVLEAMESAVQKARDCGDPPRHIPRPRSEHDMDPEG